MQVVDSEVLLDPVPRDAADAATQQGRRSRAPDFLGLIWVLSVGVLVLIPALLHGALLGPYDLLSNYGLSAEPHSVAHNNLLGDQIMMLIPWTNLVWTQVHHGQLPLWNPYSVLGAPLAFNWVSAPFSVAVAFGYLFPVNLAYTVQIIVTVLIAGSGVYVLGRVLRLTPLGSAMAATVFELSGPFIGWLGWPNSSVMAFAGWIFAATILILRGERRARNIAFFALVLACAVYAGDPEALLLVVVAPTVFAILTLLQRMPALKGSGPLLRPAVDYAAATVAGLALGAPLILPGLQIASTSNRSVVGTSNGPQTLPVNDASHLIFQGFDGLPFIHSQYFGYSNYIETAMYVGVIPLVLAVTAVIVHWKRPEVRSFSILAVVMGLLVFVPSLASILDKVVDAYWLFALQPMILALAVLSGMGTDSVIRSQHDLRARKLLGIGFLVAAALLVVIWLTAERGLSPQQANIRAHSFIWPAIEVVVGLVVVFGLMKLPEGTPSGRSRWAISSGSIAGVVLLATEAAFLVTAGAPLMSSSGSYLTATPAEAQLERAVGSSLVGFGESTCLNFLPGVGILENVNVVFRIREFAVYDPMTPRAYFSGWRKSPGYPNASVFCPAITSATIARRFGVSYVLEPPGHPGPTGGVFYKDVGNEGLYHIPGSAVATLVSVRAGSPFPAVAANGTPVPVSNLDSSSWKIVIDTTHPDVLRLRLTDVPGWHASIDGRPLQLYRFNRIMLQAHVPPGRHVIELSYWPTTFSIGLVLAALSAVALALLLVTGAIRARTGADRTTATNRAESAGQLV